MLKDYLFIWKEVFRLYFLTPLFLCLFFFSIKAQHTKLSVYIDGENTHNYRKVTPLQIDSLVKNEIKRLIFLNFIDASIDSLIFSQSNSVKVYISSNKKWNIDFRVSFPDSFFIAMLQNPIKWNTIHQFRSENILVLDKLQNQAYPFAQLNFYFFWQDSVYEYQAVFSNLKKILIQDIIIKSDEKIVKKGVLSSFLHLYPQKPLNMNQWNNACTLAGQNRFFSTTAPPQLEITTKGALLYFWLKKNKLNTVAGLLGFSSNDNEIKVLGQMDIKLENTFGNMEKLDFFYFSGNKSVRKLNLSISWPYIFSSAFSTNAQALFNQPDSLSLSIKYQQNVGYQLNQKLTFFTGAKYFTFFQTGASENMDNYWMNGIGMEYFYAPSARFKGSVKISIFSETKLYYSRNKSELSIEHALEYLYQSNWLFSNAFELVGRFGEFSESEELSKIGGINSFIGVAENAYSARDYLLNRTSIAFQKSIRPFIIFDAIYFDELKAKPKFLFSGGAGIEIRKKNTSVQLINGLLLSKNTINLQDYKLHLKLINYF